MMDEKMNNSNNNKITTIEITQDSLDRLSKLAKPDDGDETFDDVIRSLILYRLEDRNLLYWSLSVPAFEMMVIHNVLDPPL
jgi:hypothetical protein